ncbi:MAG: acetyl-CoA carboxylase carboxyl transferase subunit beta, partial [Butyricicoccus pullicaecorum]
MLIDLFQKTRTTSMQMKSASTLPEEKPQIVCKACGTHLQARNYGRNLYVCPSCGHYARLLARTRIRITADKDSFSELFSNIRPCNPLDFEGYSEKLETLQEKTGMKDAVITGVCTIGGLETCLGVMD